MAADKSWRLEDITQHLPRQSQSCRTLQPGVVSAQQQTLMTRQQVLDLYFMDARCKLIELAAFLDRVERTSGGDDFRLEAFRQAMGELSKANPDRARQVLLAFSDPTTDPIPAATTKAACGAWPGES